MINPKKILIIRFSSIGDIVLTTPLLRILRKKFPNTRIDFVVKKEFSELIRYNTNLSNIIEYDVATGFSGLNKIKCNIKKENYDLIIDIHNNLRSIYLRIFSGAKKIVKINKRIIARTLLIKFKKNIYRKITSVAERYIEPVSYLGLNNDYEGLEIFIPENINSIADSKISSLKFNLDKKIIGFVPSAKHNTKCWPEEHFINLGIMLTSESYNIILLGDASDKKRCEFITNGINKAVGKNSAADLSGATTLLETAAIIKKCELIVTNDTGLMHIASAIKKKVVALFGPTVIEFGFFPVNQQSIVIENKGLYCRPCSHIGSNQCPEGHFKCMKDISPERVFENIKQLLKI